MNQYKLARELQTITVTSQLIVALHLIGFRREILNQ